MNAILKVKGRPYIMLAMAIHILLEGVLLLVHLLVSLPIFKHNGTETAALCKARLSDNNVTVSD